MPVDRQTVTGTLMSRRSTFSSVRRDRLANSSPSRIIVSSQDLLVLQGKKEFSVKVGGQTALLLQCGCGCMRRGGPILGWNKIQSVKF